MKLKSIFLMVGCSLFMAIASSQELNILAAEFINTLNPELKSQTIFELDSEERLNFNFVPIIRKGPTFHDFNEKQKQAAMALLRASLSREGLRKTEEIMALEDVLHEIEGGKFTAGEDKDLGPLLVLIQDYRTPLQFQLQDHLMGQLALAQLAILTEGAPLLALQTRKGVGRFAHQQSQFVTIHDRLIRGEAQQGGQTTTLLFDQGLLTIAQADDTQGEGDTDDQNNDQDLQQGKAGLVRSVGVTGCSSCRCQAAPEN